VSTEAREFTVLEGALHRAQTGKISVQSAVWTLAASELTIATKLDLEGSHADVQPLVVAQDGASFLALFTHPDQIGSYAKEMPGFIAMSGQDVLQRMPGTRDWWSTPVPLMGSNCRLPESLQLLRKYRPVEVNFPRL
jgi:hypothetical protein